MDNMMVALIAVALLLLATMGLLLGLQVWLAGRKKLLWGLVQPAVWAAFALVGNLLPRVQGIAVEGGLHSTGAVVMAALSLVVFLLCRRRIQKNNTNSNIN